MKMSISAALGQRFLVTGKAMASLFLAVLCSAAPGITQAQTRDFPNRPITLILPATPGGFTDVVARLIGERLTAAWGQPVVMDYKPGSNAMLAFRAGKAAPADGYTLLVAYTAFTQNLALRNDSGYAISDFAPVSQLLSSNTVFVVSPSLGANSVAEFTRVAKGNPAKYAIGNAGTGSTGHIIAAIVEKTAGLEVTHVPYKAEQPALMDLLGGRVVAVGALTLNAVTPFVKTGQLKPLAVTGDRRLSQLPDVPTWSEAGYSSANITGWTGILAPANTPPEIVRKLSDEISRIVQLPDVAQKLRDSGGTPVGSKSVEFGQYIESDLRRWKSGAQFTNIRLE